MERKFETPNGNIVAESQLRRDYPSLFNKYVQEGTFRQVDGGVDTISQEEMQIEESGQPVGNEFQSSGEMYESPNGNVKTDTAFVQEYGVDVFQQYVEEGVLKKKSQNGGEQSSESVSSGSGTSGLPLNQQQDVEKIVQKEIDWGNKFSNFFKDASDKGYTEQDYFTGGFGDALRGLDSIVPLGIGDFIDDMARSVAGGVAQGFAAEEASDLLLSGTTPDMAQIQRYLDANRDAQAYGMSAEMQEYQATYEEHGGLLGVILGLAKSGGTVLPELILSSFSSMASNTDSLATFGAIVGGGAAVGAATGAGGGTVVVPGFGTVVGGAAGAISGALSALPYAFAAAGSALEIGSTFSELLQEEAQGEELTAELVKEILNDPEKYSSIRNKAVARGLVIGAIDAVTGKIGGKIGTKILTKGGKQSSKMATKGLKMKSILGAGAVEAVGGSTGEATARAAIGQDMDVSEIALEGLAEIPGGVKDIVATRFSKATYKVNGEKVDGAVIDDLIETMTLEELQSSDIVIKNDYEGRKGKMQDRVLELSTKKLVTEANPGINSKTLDKIVELQLELNKLEGNKTQVAKEKANKIKREINDLTENQISEEVENEVVGEQVTNDEVIKRIGELKGEDAVYTTQEYKNVKSLLEQEKMDAAAEGTIINQVQDFNDLGNDEQASYLEQAGGNIESARNLYEQDKQGDNQSFDDNVESLNDEITADGKPRFRLDNQTDESLINAEGGDVEAIANEMDAMNEEEQMFTVPEVSSKTQVAPMSESKSTQEFTQADAKALGFESVEQMEGTIEEFDGIPMVTGISDLLGSGTYTDSKGNPMEINGGLGFNSRGKNKNAAWAGVGVDKSEAQVKAGVEAYNKNPALFDRLWAEGKLPNGHVPMAIIRMGNDAVNSNEAVFRWMAPEIKSQSKKNQTSAMNALITRLEAQTKTKKGEKATNILNQIKDNKVKTLGQLMDLISKQAKERAQGKKSTMSLDERGMIFTHLVAGEGAKKNGKPTIKALYEGAKKNNSNIFTADNIYSAIGEPSMLKSNKGDVVAIMGIDVRNGGEVITIDHENYGTGPKGRLIKLIKNPTNGIDIFPSWKAKTNRMFKKDKQGRLPNQKVVAGQTMGTAATDQAFQMDKVTTGGISDMDLLSAKLRFAFPGVTVSNTVEAFNEAINEEGTRTQETKGKKILGLTKDGKVILNPDSKSLATPIHEFGHIWIDFLRSKASGAKGTKLLAQGLKLVEGTQALKDAIAKYGDNKLAREEALVELMATKGETIINAAKKSKFKEWMNGTFKYIKEKFSTTEELKSSQIQNMSLEDFINTGLADLFAGRAVDAESKIKFDASDTGTSSKSRLRLSDEVNNLVDALIETAKEKASKRGKELRAIPKSIMDIVNNSDSYNKADDIQRQEILRDITRKLGIRDSYERVMGEVDGIIEKSKKRGVKFSKIPENVINYLQGTKLYENMTDVQREAMLRDIRKKLGLKEKKAPGVKRILGITNPKKITVSEKQGLVEQIKLLNRGAKTAVQAWAKASVKLTKEIKDMVGQGKISPKQMAAVISKFSRVNMFNDSSIERFVDYMSKVFANAEYADTIKRANIRRKQAIKNIKTKIGIADAVKPQLQRLFSVNPSLIPDSVLETYMELVDMMGERKTVLDLTEISEVTDKTEAILKQLDEEQSMAIELSETFDNFEGKVTDDDGKVDYASTLALMKREGVITDEQLEVMKKYKKQIMPIASSIEVSEAEQEQRRQELLKELESKDIVNTNELPSQDERDLANSLQRLLKTKGAKELSQRDIQNLLRVIDNINNGYLPHYAQVMVEKINANNDSTSGANAVKRSKLLPITRMYSKLKSILTRRKSIDEMVRRNPLFYIDQLFGDFKTKDIFNAVFGKAAQAVAKFRTDLKSVQGRIEKAERAVMKEFGRDNNKFVNSKFKQMAYMIELEHLSNPNNKEVNPVSDFLKATIKRIKSGNTKYGKTDAKMLQDILDTYTDSNGNFDNDALYNSFSKAEKNSIKILQDINAELGPKATYTANIIRGEGIKPRANYVHLNVIQENAPGDVMGAPSFVEQYNNSLRPSTRAKSNIERTGAVSALDFDVYASVQRGAKYTLMDFHLTEPIRTSRRTLNRMEEKLNGDTSMSDKQQEIFNAIKAAFDESVENLLMNSYTENSVADKVFDYVQKQGYRSILAGTGRFVAELTSNMSYALIVDPKSFIMGTKMMKMFNSENGVNIMRNLGSTETNRLYPSDTLSGKMVDSNILNQSIGVSGGKAKNKFSNFLGKMWNQSGQRWIKGVEFTADTLISTPDKLIMKPIWFGTFEKTFTKITGKKPDFAKISANDTAYMEQYRDALSEAKTRADKSSVMAGATDNAFMGLLKGTNRPNMSMSLKAFNAFNNFMTRFLIFEYVTARTGIMNMIGKGELSKAQGAALIGGVTSRMVLYTLVGSILSEALSELTNDDDDKDDLFAGKSFGDTVMNKGKSDSKSFDKRLGQSFASAFTSLLFGRDFGNATKSIINYGIEDINENQLQFLRDGDYDPYKDGIQYNIVPRPKQGRGTGLADFLMKMGAAYGPILGTADLLTKKLTEPDRKTADARERQDAERYVRLPLELLGNLGFIPLYKDVRKMVLADIYGDLTRAQKLAKENTRTKKEMLQGYSSETDMKRYDRELWEKTYGPNSPGYDERQALKNIEKAKREIRRQQKDELYNYVPKPKRKTYKKKSENSFGPKKKSRNSSFGPGRGKAKSSPFNSNNTKGKSSFN